MVDFVALQKEICRKYRAEYVETSFDQLIGIALDTLKSGVMPVHGLRHPKESEQSANWYIWAGEYSGAEDFFQSVHIRHLVDLYPDAIQYLGMAPGWRFLIADGHEDVWYDVDLLLL